MDEDKKKRVIHTRVTEELEEELKERAASLGVSVSNLVRNVLENTLGLVEDIVADSHSVARSARGHGTRVGFVAPVAPGTDPDAPIVAWQKAVLNLNAVCGSCNEILPRGSEAAIGITDRPGPKPVLCPPCLQKLNEQPKADGGDEA